MDRSRSFAKLSEIIDTLNERFGTEFTEADKVFVDQIEQTCVENEAPATQARINSPENFKLALDKVLEGDRSRRDFGAREHAVDASADLGRSVPDLA